MNRKVKNYCEMKMMKSYFSTVHSSRCADRISVCTISVPDYDFMAAQCTAKMFSGPAAKCYCDRANWSHGLARRAKEMSL